MTACAICSVPFASNIPVAARLRLQRRHQSTFQRWLFCADCLYELKIHLGSLTYLVGTGAVVIEKKD